MAATSFGRDCFLSSDLDFRTRHGVPAARSIDATWHLSNPISAGEMGGLDRRPARNLLALFQSNRLARRGSMSNYDDGRGDVQDAPLTREPGGDTSRYGGAAYGAPQQMPPYGYQQQWVMRPKRVYPIETKPFFLTSEFVARCSRSRHRDHRRFIGCVRGLARLDPDHGDHGRLHDQPRHRQVGNPLARRRSARALRPPVGSRPASARATREIRPVVREQTWSSSRTTTGIRPPTSSAGELR